jgi:hypothetical protein
MPTRHQEPRHRNRNLPLPGAELVTVLLTAEGRVQVQGQLQQVRIQGRVQVKGFIQQGQLQGEPGCTHRPAH